MGKTRGVHETTPELRNRMVGMYEAGLGLREIAAAINCSQRTVKRWLNRFDKEGTVETRERCGRKRATTSEQDDAIVQLATQTPITAAKAVLPALGLNCSVDTIRERLHKAGIHNWSPSRKHIQRIPLGEAEGAALQQAVWRPTGTQLGKKKNLKVQSKEKNSVASRVKMKTTKQKKKKQKKKTVSKTTTTCEILTVADQQKQLEAMPFNHPETVIHCTDLPPLCHSSPIINNHNSFHTQTVANSQTMYQHQADINISENWPLDLVQSGSNQNQYLHNQANIPLPSTSSHLQELYPQNNHLQHHQILEPQPQMNTSMKLNQRSKSLNISETSSSSNSTTETAECVDEPLKDNAVKSRNMDLIEEDDQQTEANNIEKRKKGGKAKGTLETSVELRNRMIGMSQAGLSTLSIALAINRSERTVKRWLERWKKEGNVQTKERKGRRRITTKEQDEAIIAMATQNPLTAAKHVAPALGLNCSVDTIRERLHKAGIHSWKLGKKQGEGNAVHTVHLWQPSGNRPNRPRILRKNNFKRPVGKKQDVIGSKKSNGKRKISMKNEEKISNSSNIDVECTRAILQVENIQAPPLQVDRTIEQSSTITATTTTTTTIQFHDDVAMNNYNSNTNILQPVSILTQLNPSPSVQQIHAVGGPQRPVMRPDCRMATGQVSSGAYSSCMVANGGHMEQPDPLNYEPYIWNF